MDSKVYEKVIEILTAKIEMLEWQLKRAENETAEAKAELRAEMAKSK